MRIKLQKYIWPILIGFLFLLSLFIRFYQIDNPKLGFYIDESAIGYNAYSILETGKDEFGKSFPVLFRSFGDFKAPLYIYSSIIPIKIFGLSVFSTRFISAFSGSITVLIVFLFLKRVTGRNLFPALTALVVAVSPWSVYYSRGAWESNLSFFLLVLAAFLCYLGYITKKRVVFLLGAVIFVLSTYAYHSQRIVAPLIFTSYLFVYRKWLLEKTKFLVFGFIVLLILALPLLKASLTPGGQSRIKSTSYFSAQAILPWQNQESPANNRLFITIRKGIALYTAYFSPRNLFSPDPGEKQRWLVDLSVFYPWQFIFYIIGIVCFFQKKDYAFLRQIILPWLLFSPVAASLTGDPFASQRSIPLIFPFSVIIALGIFESYLFIKKKISLKFKIKYLNLLLGSFFLLVVSASLISLLTQLLYILPYQRAKYWEVGYSKLGQDLLYYTDEKIVIDSLKLESYIQILFFTKFDPRIYQKEAGYLELPNYYSSFERALVKKFGQFESRKIDWGKELKEKNIIVGDDLIVSEEQILKDPRLELLKEIYYPDQSVAFKIIKALKE